MSIGSTHRRWGSSYELRELIESTANRIDRINANLDELAYTYDDVVPGLFPAAPTYEDAAAVVRRRLGSLLP